MLCEIIEQMLFDLRCAPMLSGFKLANAFILECLLERQKPIQTKYYKIARVFT